jgi:hypothetical protein
VQKEGSADRAEISGGFLLSSLFFPSAKISLASLFLLRVLPNYCDQAGVVNKAASSAPSALGQLTADLSILPLSTPEPIPFSSLLLYLFEYKPSFSYPAGAGGEISKTDRAIPIHTHPIPYHPRPTPLLSSSSNITEPE